MSPVQRRREVILAAHEAEKQFKVSLPAGRHKLTLRVEVSNNEAPELKLELTKPEGSAIQFDVVGGA